MQAVHLIIVDAYVQAVHLIIVDADVYDCRPAHVQAPGMPVRERMVHS
jgi:hypothetical protein